MYNKCELVLAVITTTHRAFKGTGSWFTACSLFYQNAVFLLGHAVLSMQ